MIEIKVPVIPGKKNHLVGKIEISPGDEVKKDDILLTIETAKGNREIKAPEDAYIEEILVAEGDEVSVGEKIIILKEKEESLSANEETLVEVKVPIIPGKKDHILGKLEISLGDEVKNGQTLCTIETAKGSREIKSPVDGLVEKILYKEEDEVSAGDVLFILKAKLEVTKDVDNQEKSEDQEERLIKKDLLVIGAGPGGYVAAIYGAKRGLDVALVEKENLGGTCLNVGCIPTKALVESAKVYEELENMADFGIEGEGEFSLNMAKVLQRKDSIVDNLVSGVDHLIDKNKIELIEGKAQFLDDKKVRVKNTLIEAENIIIATGSVENTLKVEGHDLPGVITSTEALYLKDLPESLVVIGGGVIGLEFASIYKTFGSDVHIVEYQDSLLPMFDSDCGREMQAICTDKGIRVSTAAKVVSITESIEGKYIVSYEKDGKTYRTIGDKVLMATGRKANIEGLGLDNTSINYDKKTDNIFVDEYRKTNLDHIFAIGDVSSRLKLAHLASHEAILVVDYIMGDKRELTDKDIPSVVYTKPEIASIGYSEDELKSKNISYKKSLFDFAANGKAMTMDQNEGFIKLMTDEDDKILGCVIIGPDASNLISDISIVIKNDLSAKDLAHTVFAHPSTSEVIHEAALGILGRVIHQ